MNSFRSSLPAGFWSKIKKQVVTMKTPIEAKKKVEIMKGAVLKFYA